MVSLLRSEWYKLRKSKIVYILLVGPVVGLIIGIFTNIDMLPLEMNQWVGTLMMMNLTYALLFLPLITGVLAGMICKYEHDAGGWKQLLALPVTRGKVFVAKYFLLMLLILAIQVFYLVSLLGIGFAKGFTDTFPIEVVWKSILGGWVATLPLASLQLWMSMMFKSFAASFSVNVIFTLPTIVIVNSERFGPYYPWAQPFSMMYLSGDTNDIFFVPWDHLLTVVGGSFIAFFVAGFIYFQRKAV
ncbi:ABC transporter permease [Ornithinibacillus californiensis]|uniref:ABC transporter permease n=1 Tax=Ornithinibacillus californiensis TaxID=161536 RepID=UPI00064DC876|nr:ABC transporter permease [Ornithinibacillus californiensis]